MVRRSVARVEDIKNAIRQIRTLLDGERVESLGSEPITRAAFERFLEIISEASRHVPDEWKATHRHIPWREIAALGNRLGHAYQNIDATILWAIYEHDLDPLEAAVDRMLAVADRLGG